MPLAFILHVWLIPLSRACVCGFSSSLPPPTGVLISNNPLETQKEKKKDISTRDYFSMLYLLIKTG